MEKREDYWNAESPTTEGVLNFDSIEYRFYTQRDISFEAFQKGEFDQFAVYTSSRWIKETSEDTNGISFEFDDDEEEVLEEDSLDLAIEMMESKIQKAAGMVLINSRKNDVSDIHIEPFEKDLSVRLRVDGVLQEDVQPPRGWKEQLVSRIKVMSNLDIAKKNIPQDGRIRTRMAGREVDIRVSTLPVRHGERVVMRLLEKKTNFLMF